jgi:hypothetical protein
MELGVAPSCALQEWCSAAASMLRRAERGDQGLIVVDYDSFLTDPRAIASLLGFEIAAQPDSKARREPSDVILWMIADRAVAYSTEATDLHRRISTISASESVGAFSDADIDVDHEFKQYQISKALAARFREQEPVWKESFRHLREALELHDASHHKDRVRLEDELDRLRDERLVDEGRYLALRSQLDRIRHSTSWRLTAPLRRMVQFLRLRS